VTWCLDPKRARAATSPPGSVTSYASGHKVLTSKDRGRASLLLRRERRPLRGGQRLWIGSVAHTSARIRCSPAPAASATPTSARSSPPSRRGEAPQLALPYVDLGGGAYAGPLASVMGRVGTTNQLVTLIDRSKAFRGSRRQALSPTTRAGGAGGVRRPGGPGWPRRRRRRGARELHEQPRARRRAAPRPAAARDERGSGDHAGAAGGAGGRAVPRRGGLRGLPRHAPRLGHPRRHRRPGTSHEQLFAELTQIASNLDGSGAARAHHGGGAVGV
jgi:hypothetical protein